MNRTLVTTVLVREWRTRVLKKGFWLGTFLMPVLSVGFLVGTVLLSKDAEVNHRILVEDAPGLITRMDVASGQFVPRCPGCFPERQGHIYRFVQEAMPDSVWLEQGYTLLVEFDESVLQNKAGHLVYASVPGMDAKRNIERDLSRAIEHARVLEGTELDWEAYQRLKFDMRLVDRVVEEDGSRVSGGGEGIRGIVGFFFSAILFLVLAVYGGLILRSVVEEKTNRVVEVLVATVRPEELLLGKVLGSGLVALTQLFSWSILSTAAFLGFQFIFDASSAMPTGEQVPADLLTVMSENEFTSVLLDIQWGWMMLGTVAFFVGGYLLYGSVYAAIGGAARSEQEGQGMVFPVILPLMFAYVIGSGAMSNPEMSALVGLSWFPLTSPVIMLVRMAIGVPAWEVVGSWVLLLFTARLMLGLAGRAYRHGVLHQGSQSGWRLLSQWVKGNVK